MFFAKTVKYPGEIKAMFDVLFQNLTMVCFTIDSSGMRAENVTSQNMLIAVNLPADAFDEYRFDDNEPMHIGLGSHTGSFFKTCKSKWPISLSITQPFVLYIEVKDESRSATNVDESDEVVTSMSATIQSIQNIASVDIGEYSSKWIIDNAKFASLCKSLKSPLVNVTRQCGQLSFSYEIYGVQTKTTKFGKYNPDDIELCFQTFRSDQFIRISKLASFAKSCVEIHFEKDRPLYILSRGHIGTIGVVMSAEESSSFR